MWCVLCLKVDIISSLRIQNTEYGGIQNTEVSGMWAVYHLGRSKRTPSRSTLDLEWMPVDGVGCQLVLVWVRHSNPPLWRPTLRVMGEKNRWGNLLTWSEERRTRESSHLLSTTVTMMKLNGAQKWRKDHDALSITLRSVGIHSKAAALDVNNVCTCTTGLPHLCVMRHHPLGAQGEGRVHEMFRRDVHRHAVNNGLR